MTAHVASCDSIHHRPTFPHRWKVVFSFLVFLHRVCIQILVSSVSYHSLKTLKAVIFFSTPFLLAFPASRKHTQSCASACRSLLDVFLPQLPSHPVCPPVCDWKGQYPKYFFFPSSGLQPLFPALIFFPFGEIDYLFRRVLLTLPFRNECNLSSAFVSEAKVEPAERGHHSLHAKISPPPGFSLCSLEQQCCKFWFELSRASGVIGM
jgi:hypothetical protein